MTINDIRNTLDQHILIESVAPTAGNNVMALTATTDDWPELGRVLMVRQCMTFRVAEEDDKRWAITKWWFGAPTALTIGVICDVINSAILQQASKPDGPDLDDKITHIMGPVGCPALKRVLDAKGCLVIKLRQLPKLADGMYLEAGAAQLAEMRAQATAGAAQNKVPGQVMVDGRMVNL